MKTNFRDYTAGEITDYAIIGDHYLHHQKQQPMNDFIYVPVSIIDEMPTVEGDYFIIPNRANTLGVLYHSGTKSSETRWFVNVKYWLKKVPVSEYRNENIKELLKKQRELCAEHAELNCNCDGWESCHGKVDKDSILNAPEPSISPIQEDWKEKLRLAAKNYSEQFYQDGIGIMGASYADFVKGAEWVKQYIEENIINKTNGRG